MNSAVAVPLPMKSVSNNCGWLANSASGLVYPIRWAVIVNGAVNIRFVGERSAPLSVGPVKSSRPSNTKVGYETPLKVPGPPPTNGLSESATLNCSDSRPVQGPQLLNNPPAMLSPPPLSENPSPLSVQNPPEKLLVKDPPV